MSGTSPELSLISVFSQMKIFAEFVKEPGSAMLRICKELREVDAKAKTLGQTRTEIDYILALLDAMANMDTLLEVEVLKSLGDLNLEHGKKLKDVAKFDRAKVLYKAALHRCEDKEIKESLEYRISYAEKLQPARESVSSVSSLVQVAEMFANLNQSLTIGSDKVSPLIEYTKIMVEGIVNEDNILETEAIKSVGDVYLKRGTETRDTPCLTKATALYNTALARCEGVQGAVALIHRLLYTARIREDMKKTANKQIFKGSKSRGQRSQSHHLSRDLPGSSSSSDVMAGRGSQKFMSAGAGSIAGQTSHRAAPDYRTYEKHLTSGDGELTDGNLDLAEQKIVSALKLIHDKKEPDRRREADCLCRLGDVYLQTGKRTKEGRKFTQAAALYNAALARLARTDENRHKVMKRLQDVERSFLCYTANVDSEPSSTESHQKRLEDIRALAKSQLEAIDLLYNPYQYDEDDPKMLPVEVERAEAVKALCKFIAKDRQMFIQALINECIGTIGPPPCKYAFIGLGSQATEVVTPYSDLEFAILIEEGKDNDDTRRYFLNLTHYLHLKVINLGETILPAMAIPSLNDFQSEDPANNWFFDSVTPHGFAFDGFMPWASKTPFGRDQTKSKPPVSLIQTPAEMAKFQQTEISLAEGYNLSDILRRFVFLAGHEELVKEYMEILKTVIKDDLLSHVQARRLSSFTMQPLMESMGKTGAFEPGRQMLDITKKDIEKMGNIPVFELPTGQLLNVKKDIYRSPGIAIELLAVFCNIALSASTWDVIDEMMEAGWIHEEDAKHLTVLTSISAELRLRTYMANGGQKDSLSPLAKLDNTDLKSAFHIPDVKILFRYYCRAKPLRMCMPDMILGRKFRGQPKRVFETAIFDALNENMGRIAGSLFLLDKSILYLDAAVTDAGSDLEKRSQILNDLGLSYKERGDLQKAISCHQQSLTIERTILGSHKHPGTVKSLHNLGLAKSKLGDYKTATSYLEQALGMKKTVSGDYVADDETAACLNSLGHCWRNLGLYEKAISFYEQFLTMMESLIGNNKPHPDIAGALNNIGICCHELPDHKEAIKYWEKSLAMMTTVYGDNTAHPDIAMLLTNLGSAWRALGDLRKAISYLERSLKMLKTIHGEKHPDVARTLLNLGTFWLSHGNHEKAVEYCEQSLTMRKGIYEDNTPHPEIAISLHNLGACWATIGDHKKAILYFEEALTMRKTIFGDSSTHPDITALLNNLAISCSRLGDEKKANSYWVQLQAMKAREAAP
ncbi:uncharacterized protein LOC144871928 [Branchiostoma floridae x Branchiostoma japonicum]